MIQHLQISHNDMRTVMEAASAAGLAYDAMLEWIVCDWTQTYRNRQAARIEFVAALQDAYGVVPGGD